MSKTMQLKQLHIVLVLAMLLAALAPAVGVSSVQAQAAETAPPVLLTTAPDEGETWDGGPVIFTFDKEMSAAEILVSPALAGDTSIEGTEAAFTPTDTPEANTRYRFYLAQSLRDAGNLEVALEHYRRRARQGGWAEEVYVSLLQAARLNPALEAPAQAASNGGR